MPYKKIIDNLKGSTYLYLSNIGEDDIQALAKELKGTLITTLDLYNSSIGCHGLKNLVQVLNYTKITELDLRNNNIQDEGVKYLSEIIENTEITGLDLSENIIGIDAAQCLCEKLSNTKIKNLCLDIYYKTDGNVHKFISQRSRNNDIKMTCITINNNKIGIQGAYYLNKIFQTIGIGELQLDTHDLHEDEIQHLAQAFKNIKIGNYCMCSNHLRQPNGIEYLIKIFKDSYIVKLNLCNQKIGAKGAIYLAEFLKKVTVLDLGLHYNFLRDKGMQYLAPVLKDSDIMYINLSKNYIEFEGARYLVETLRNSKILDINLTNNRIGPKGAKYLADGLSYSQVTHIHLHGNNIEYAGYQYLVDIADNTNLSWVNLHNNNIEDGLKEGTKLSLESIPRNTITIAYRICEAFKKLVSLNLISDEFEFIVPEKETNPTVNLDEYPFLIRTLNNVPNSKVHIFHMMCKSCFNFDFNIMNKINVFIEIMPNKFNTLIENELPNLIESFGFDTDKYVKLVKEFAEMKLHEVVQNLLLHRVLYYIDENQEILHPYIYKMLDKYSMPLYNAQLEPHKKEKIISYFQNHQEIDGVQEIIDLL